MGPSIVARNTDVTRLETEVEVYRREEKTDIQEEKTENTPVNSNPNPRCIPSCPTRIGL